MRRFGRLLARGRQNFLDHVLHENMAYAMHDVILTLYLHLLGTGNDGLFVT